MQQLSVFVDCHVFDGAPQGTRTYIEGLYRELVKHRNITFYFGASNVASLKQVFGEDSNIRYLKYASENKWYRLFIDIPLLIKKNKIHFAHFQYIVPPIKYCKYINTIHDVLFLDFTEYFPASYRVRNKLLFYLSANRTDILLTVSNYSAERILRHFKLNAVVTPNAVDPAFFEKYDRSDMQRQAKDLFGLENYWLFVSRWEPRKNHITILRTFVEQGYFNEYSLVFVGDDALDCIEFNTYFEQLSPSIQNTIHRLKKVDYKTLLYLVRAASLSVYPSHAEGFGIPPLESAAARIPTVVSNTTAMADFVVLKEYMFNPDNRFEMNDRIQKALQISEEQLTHIADSVYSHYNWSASASVLLSQLRRK